jgi:hypothetical protein
MESTKVLSPLVVRNIFVVVTTKISRPWLAIMSTDKIIAPPFTAKKQHEGAVFLNAVDLGIGFWNKFAKEVEYLSHVLEEK